MRWTDEQGNELSPKDVPYHLRSGVPPLASCSGCGRKTWSSSELGQPCEMLQPDGTRCKGSFPLPTQPQPTPSPSPE
jgi:hypothetical protein